MNPLPVLLQYFLPVFDTWAASGGVQCSVGAMEAPLASEPWLGDALTFDLLHLSPLLPGQQKVHMLNGDILTVDLRVDARVYRNLQEKIMVRIRLFFMILKSFKKLL